MIATLRRCMASAMAMRPLAGSSCGSSPVTGQRCPPRLQPSRSTHNYRELSPCLTCCLSRDKEPCFDLENLVIVRANTRVHTKSIRSFLYAQYWPREPSVCAAWLPLTSNYIALQTEKFAASGDRYIAYERLPRTGELKMIGLLCCNKVYPWDADELEEWSTRTCSGPEQVHMCFKAHCIRSPDLFGRYNVPFYFELEALCTDTDVGNQGVGRALVQFALADANELRHPAVALVATSKYAATICSRLGLPKVWGMTMADYVDIKGKSLFFPRAPHTEVGVYAQKYAPNTACKPSFFK